MDDDGEDDFDSEEGESEIDYSDGDYIIPDSQNKPRQNSEKRKRKAGLFSSFLSSSKWSVADDKQPSG